MNGTLKILELDIVANSGLCNVSEMVNYNQIGLVKKKLYSKGLLLKTEYFVSKNGNVYENKILEETYQYLEQSVLFVGIITTINWLNTEDEIGYTKTFVKEFLPNEIINFGIERRSNVIANVKLYVFQTIGEVNAFDLLGSVESEISTYEQGYTSPLVDKVQSLVGVKPYLTQQIADAINSQLTDLTIQP